MSRFEDKFVDVGAKFSIGVDHKSGEKYLSIPVTIGIVDYEEYYAISEEEERLFLGHSQRAKIFADDCRAHKEDSRLIVKPGWNRGTPV